MIYGIGKFLRTSRYRPTFQASAWRGSSTPQGAVRGVYFASHFHNWYVQASEAAMHRLVELYHCQIETDDPYHHRVRPPLRQVVDRNGRK